MGLTSVRLTNKTAQPCTIRGYAQVRLLDAAGRVVRSTLSHGSVNDGVFSDPGPRTVRLDPGQTASAELGWQDNVVTVHGKHDTCPAVAYLRVDVPAATRGLTIRPGRGTRYGAYSIHPCDSSLIVTAMQRGANPKKQ